MKEFNNKVAVITGGGNGIGRQLCLEAAKRDMHVVVADIHLHDAQNVVSEILNMGKRASAIAVDVTLFSECQKMFDFTIKEYGRADLLINNAGISVGADIWDLPLQDIDWIYELNVKAQMYTIRIFVPQMKKQGNPCHIVNVASIAGLLPYSGMPAYHATKYASVGLSEAIFHKLETENSNIGISVFCPGFVQTEMYKSDRHRPARYAIDNDEFYKTSEYEKSLEISKMILGTGIEVETVGPIVFDAIIRGDFYILSHEKYMEMLSKKGIYITNKKRPAKLELSLKERN